MLRHAELLLNLQKLVHTQIIRTIKYRAFMFQLLIIPGKNVIPGNFEFTRSNVKVKWLILVINYMYVKQLPPNILNFY